MRHVRLVVLLALTWSVAANAATLRLRAEDHGLWGAELRACKGRVTRSHCALITPLVMADSGIAFEDLRKLPAGKKIFIDESYLDPSFEVSTPIRLQALAIFDETPAVTNNNTEAIRSLEEKIAEITKEKDAAREALRAATADLENMRTELTSAQSRLSETEAKAATLEQKLASRPAPPSRLRAALEMTIMFFLGISAGVIFCLWWFQIFKRNNVTLPQYEEVDDHGTKRGFRLRPDYTYDCLDCEKETQAPGAIGRERGKRIRLENLQKHVTEVEHSHAEMLHPIERTA